MITVIVTFLYPLRHTDPPIGNFAAGPARSVFFQRSVRPGTGKFCINLNTQMIGRTWPLLLLTEGIPIGTRWLSIITFMCQYF